MVSWGMSMVLGVSYELSDSETVSSLTYPAIKSHHPELDPLHTLVLPTVSVV